MPPCHQAFPSRAFPSERRLLRCPCLRCSFRILFPAFRHMYGGTAFAVGVLLPGLHGPRARDRLGSPWICSLSWMELGERGALVYGASPLTRRSPGSRLTADSAHCSTSLFIPVCPLRSCSRQPLAGITRLQALSRPLVRHEEEFAQWEDTR